MIGAVANMFKGLGSRVVCGFRVLAFFLRLGTLGDNASNCLCPIMPKPPFPLAPGSLFSGFITLNPKPQTLNPKPQTLNPKP